MLRGSFVELDNVLKSVGWAPSGAAAKTWIREGRVCVNGRPEARVRRKLRPGDTVSFQGRTLRIAAASQAAT
ncbi:MAG: RNA-binding S4 domain-containing protein [Deltaproteobacteria bacterium]